MQIEPKVLENRFVRLEPLAERHKADLREACDADPQTWTELYLYSMAGDQFDPTWRKIMHSAELGEFIPFAVMDQDRCRGISIYVAIDRPNRSLEIGGTYYHPDLRGKAFNPAAKRLLFDHAFTSGADRVQLKVDSINARSRAAVLKLGAVQEGIIRHERITWTGRVRDSVVFSVLAEEWPAVRERLDARLAAFS
jgi:RimJ/RimL family protein N-acetyltransferase